jgi:hypothetical protein
MIKYPIDGSARCSWLCFTGIFTGRTKVPLYDL